MNAAKAQHGAVDAVPSLTAYESPLKPGTWSVRTKTASGEWINALNGSAVGPAQAAANARLMAAAPMLYGALLDLITDCDCNSPGTLAAARAALALADGENQ